MIEKWCQNTSLNGISDLYESRNEKGHFIFWICVMIVMLGLMVLLIFTNIMSFINSPIITKMENIVAKDLEMPEILLCYKGGLNVAKLKSFNFSDELISVLQHGYFSKIKDINMLFVEKEFISFLQIRNISVKRFYELIASHDCPEIIMNRRRAGDLLEEDSKCLNVSLFVGEDTYPCLHLKKNGFQTASNPVKGGLQLTVSTPKGAQVDNRESYNFTDTFSMALDKSFFVQGDINIEIPLGYKFTIMLSLSKFVRLKTNQRCFHRDNVPFQSGSCHKVSLYNITSARCNCTIPGIRHNQLKEFPDNVCSVFEFRKGCLDQWPQVILETYRNTRERCVTPCEEFVYTTSLSFITLEPKNISKILLGYSHMQYTNVEEVASFTWDLAVANVGGQAGLWMGCSIVTIIQAFYYFVLCLCHDLQNRKLKLELSQMEAKLMEIRSNSATSAMSNVVNDD